MKSYVLHDINDFYYEDTVEPALTEGTVLVKVHAAGICGSDILRIYKNGTYHYPLIPGHEFSGEVVKTFNPDDSSWLGRRVGVFPLIPCMKCIQCREKKYEMCTGYSYLGSRTSGGFTEYVRVPVWNLIGLPDNVSYEQAAMMEPMSVAVHAIRRATGADPMKKDSVIAVYGLGTIGMLITMFISGMGYENIIGAGNKDIQKEIFLKTAGKHARYIDIRDVEFAEWIKNNTESGTDIIFECVGRNETVKEAVLAAAPGGRVQLVGNPTGDIDFPREIYWKVLRRQLTVTGTWNSSFTHEDTDDWHYVLSMLQTGKIHPEDLITHRFTMNELIKGFEIMRDKSEPYMKIIGIME